jgi:hypothetical protein
MEAGTTLRVAVEAVVFLEAGEDHLVTEAVRDRILPVQN